MLLVSSPGGLSLIRALIVKLKKILGSDKLIMEIIVDELKEIRQEYGDKRKTEIRDEVITDIRPEDLIKEEDVAVMTTQSGYIKRTSLSSYQSAWSAKTFKVNVLCPLAAGNIKSLIEGRPSVLPGNARREDLERNIFEIFIDLLCHKHPLCLRHLMEAIEAGIIKHILDENHGRQKETAKLLGIKYTTLNMKVKKYHILEAEDTIHFFALEGRDPKSRREH